MRPHVAILILGSAIILVLCIVIGSHDAQSDPALRDARQRVEDLLANDKMDWQIKIRDEEWKLILARDGSEVEEEYVHCTYGDPPRRKINQDRCARLVRRIQREDAADDAKEAAAKANW